MKWDIEVIRYDEKGKKVVEHDFVEADGTITDEHNNLILFADTYQEYMSAMKRSDYGLIVAIYHSYNYISVTPIHEEE